MEEITKDELNEDEISMIISDRKIYGDTNKPCPWCNGMTLVEDIYGYERVISCTHCSYSESKTI